MGTKNHITNGRVRIESIQIEMSMCKVSDPKHSQRIEGRPVWLECFEQSGEE